MPVCFLPNFATRTILSATLKTTIIMQIKGMDGQSYSVTGSGQGTFNTVGAGAGILSFLGLNAGNILGGIGGYSPYNRTGAVEVITSDDKPISRYEAAMMDKMAAKDSEIAQLKADQYTDKKMVEVTKYVDGKVEALAAEVRANKEEQAAINLQQAVMNGKTTSTLQCMQNEIDSLDRMTRRYVPSYNVCEGGCGCGCNA